MTAKRVRQKDLRWVCDPAIFDFKSTREVPALREIIGQEKPPF